MHRIKSGSEVGALDAAPASAPLGPVEATVWILCHPSITPTLTERDLTLARALTAQGLTDGGRDQVRRSLQGKLNVLLGEIAEDLASVFVVEVIGEDLLHDRMALVGRQGIDLITVATTGGDTRLHFYEVKSTVRSSRRRPGTPVTKRIGRQASSEWFAARAAGTQADRVDAEDLEAMIVATRAVMVNFGRRDVTAWELDRLGRCSAPIAAPYGLDALLDQMG